MTLVEAYAGADRDGPSQRALRIYKGGPTQKKGAPVRLSQDIGHDYLSVALLRKLNKELPSQRDRKFAAHFAKLDALLVDRNWDGCNEPPSALALNRARAVLHQLRADGLEPTRIVSSTEGGVAICFIRGKIYSDIECLNSEEILGVVSNRRDAPVVWEIDPSASGFARAAQRIREFLGETSDAYDAERKIG